MMDEIEAILREYDLLEMPSPTLEAAESLAAALEDVINNEQV